jgi:hypothetical protein
MRSYPRSMRAIVLPLVAIVALAACAGGSARASDATALKVSYWENGRDGSTAVVWTLRCNPARGTLPRAGVACRRLAAGGPGLFARTSPSSVCTQVWGGPQVARVIGTVKGKRIWTTFTRVNGCEISRWQRVSPWLLPPGGVTR